MTKRELQKLENQLVENAWNKAQKVWANASKELDEVERLDYCQAWTYQTRGYTFLVSFKTLVAFIDDNGNMYDVLRLVYGYTVTSAKHISKFRNKFYNISEYTWREEWSYRSNPAVIFPKILSLFRHIFMQMIRIKACHVVQSQVKTMYYFCANYDLHFAHYVI